MLCFDAELGLTEKYTFSNHIKQGDWEMKEMKKLKKKMKIILIIILVLTIFITYLIATEDIRRMKTDIKGIERAISQERISESDSAYFYSYVHTDLEYPTFIDFLSTQVSELLDNGEYSILKKLLNTITIHAFYSDEACIPEIKEVITIFFNNTDDLEVALEIQSVLESEGYYNSDLILKRNSVAIMSYIEANGTEKITTTPGKGFYANKTNESSNHRVGISGSPLYDATKTTYKGDFELIHRYGVKLTKLDNNYHEISYSETKYYFRDNSIDFSVEDDEFSFDDCEFIYSGDYLFCFSKNGTLIGLAKINK